jgi:hypothetical protein
MFARCPLAVHLLQMLGDSVDLTGSFFDNFRGVIGRLSRLSRSLERFRSRLFGARRRFLGSCGSGLGLTGALFVPRHGASADHDGEHRA